MATMTVIPRWGIFDVSADGSVTAWERQIDGTLDYKRFRDVAGYHDWLKVQMNASYRASMGPSADTRGDGGTVF